MKSYKINNLTLSICIFMVVPSFAENPCLTMFPVKDTSNWGIGFIRLPNEIQIKGYSMTDSSICFIGKGVIRFNNDSAPDINPKDYVYLGNFNSILLKVFECHNTRFKVCSNSRTGAIWIDFNDINQKNLSFNTYLSILAKYRNNISDEFLNTINWANIGVNLQNSCLYLRTEPSTNGNIITCLKNNLGTEITKLSVMEFHGDWARVLVKVFIYDEENDDTDDGCAFKLIKEYIGYVKALDDNGRPNIWYSSSSY